MEEQPEKRGTASWIWVLIVLAALILIFVIWWAVSAQGPERMTAAPGPEERQPAQPPIVQSPQEQPIIIEPQIPVNIYIEREQPSTNVIVVPKGQQPPQAMERLRQVDLPSMLRYQNKIWKPSNEAVTGGDVNLKDTGASIDGNIVYAEQNAQSPYYNLYLETEPGSGVYIKYIATQ